jgi:hypothetical protein
MRFIRVHVFCWRNFHNKSTPDVWMNVRIDKVGLQITTASVGAKDAHHSTPDVYMNARIDKSGCNTSAGASQARRRATFHIGCLDECMKKLSRSQVTTANAGAPQARRRATFHTGCLDECTKKLNRSQVTTASAGASQARRRATFPT